MAKRTGKPVKKPKVQEESVSPFEATDESEDEPLTITKVVKSPAKVNVAKSPAKQFVLRPSPTKAVKPSTPAKKQMAIGTGTPIKSLKAIQQLSDSEEEEEITIAKPKKVVQSGSADAFGPAIQKMDLAIHNYLKAGVKYFNGYEDEQGNAALVKQLKSKLHQGNCN
jgi:hypothetical protein